MRDKQTFCKGFHMKESPLLHMMCVSIQPHNLFHNVVACLLYCQRKEEEDKHQRRDLLVNISKNMNLNQRDSKSISVSQSSVNSKEKDLVATVGGKGACSTLWVDSLYLHLMDHLKT